MAIIRLGQEPPKRYTKQGFVYIVKPKHSNVYKIGETDNLDRRIIQLGKKFNFPVEYVYTCEAKDCFGLEQHLHMKYDRYHLGGDWFALTNEALQDLIQYTGGAE